VDSNSVRKEGLVEYEYQAWTKRAVNQDSTENKNDELTEAQWDKC